MSHYSVAEGQQWVSNPAPLCPEPGVLTLLGHDVPRQANMITARKRSLEKVMFSQPCVGYPGHGIGHMVGYSLTWALDTLPPLLSTSGGHHWKLVQTCSLEDLTPLLPPAVVISSGGH